MPKKTAIHKMTDKQLVRKLFPKQIRKALKTVLLELNSEKPKRRKKKK
jgi:hypothetical protein